MILLGSLLARRVILNETREYKHRVHFVTGIDLWVIEHLNEEVVSVVFDELVLTGAINSQDLRPNEGFKLKGVLFLAGH